MRTAQSNAAADGAPSISGAAFAALFLIYASVNYAAGGTLFPTTFSAKSAPQGLAYALATLDARELARSLTSRVLEHLSLLLRFFLDQSQLFFAVLIPGALAAGGLMRTKRTPASGAENEAGPVRPGSGVVVAFLLVDAALMGAMAPDVPLYGQEGRYVLPLVALLFVLSGVAVAVLEAGTTRSWLSSRTCTWRMGQADRRAPASRMSSWRRMTSVPIGASSGRRILTRNTLA